MGLENKWIERKIILAFIFWYQHHTLFIETIVLSIQNPINLNSKMGSLTKAAVKIFNAIIVVLHFYHLKRELLYTYSLVKLNVFSFVFVFFSNSCAQLI